MSAKKCPNCKSQNLKFESESESTHGDGFVMVSRAGYCLDCMRILSSYEFIHECPECKQTISNDELIKESFEFSYDALMDEYSNILDTHSLTYKGVCKCGNELNNTIETSIQMECSGCKDSLEECRGCIMRAVIGL